MGGTVSNQWSQVTRSEFRRAISRTPSRMVRIWLEGEVMEEGAAGRIFASKRKDGTSRAEQSGGSRRAAIRVNAIARIISMARVCDPLLPFILKPEAALCFSDKFRPSS
jgi:hypothetical protein